MTRACTLLFIAWIISAVALVGLMVRELRRHERKMQKLLDSAVREIARLREEREALIRLRDDLANEVKRMEAKS